MKLFSSGLTVACLASSVVASVAGADQCIVLTDYQIQRASNIINVRGRVIGSFCEPCGDQYLVQSKVRVLSKDGMGQDKWLLVNGNSIDAAYTYTFDRATQCWNNLAYEIGCPSQGGVVKFCP